MRGEERKGKDKRRGKGRNYHPFLLRALLGSVMVYRVFRVTTICHKHSDVTCVCVCVGGGGWCVCVCVFFFLMIKPYA